MNGRGLLQAVLLCCLAGCGGAKTMPVEGTVTLDGQPLAGASLSFEPIRDPQQRLTGAHGAYGRSDEAGRFTLRLVENDRRGALPGRHRVRITTGDPDLDEGEQGRELLPLRYRDGSLEVEIPAEGIADLRLELSSDERLD